jgi:seryl-tRNA synthetase
MLPEVENLKREQKLAGEEVARARKEGRDASALQEAGRAKAQQIKQLDAELEKLEEQRSRSMLVLPNIPHKSVPVGKSAEDNAEVRRVGTPAAMAFTPQAHWDLGPALGIIDFERAPGSPARVSPC